MHGLMHKPGAVTVQLDGMVCPTRCQKSREALSPATFQLLHLLIQVKVRVCCLAGPALCCTCITVSSAAGFYSCGEGTMQPRPVFKRSEMLNVLRDETSIPPPVVPMVKDCTDWLVPEPKGCSSTPDPPAAVPDVAATSFTVYEAAFLDFCCRATFLEAEASVCLLSGCRSPNTGGRLATQPMLASLVSLLDGPASYSGVSGLGP
jgi:hypothetical protein